MSNILKIDESLCFLGLHTDVQWDSNISFAIIPRLGLERKTRPFKKLRRFISKEKATKDKTSVARWGKTKLLSASHGANDSGNKLEPCITISILAPWEQNHLAIVRYFQRRNLCSPATT